MEQLTCPNCKGIKIDTYDRDIDEEDISCGVMIVKYECECLECNKYFDVMVHFGIGTIDYL